MNKTTRLDPEDIAALVGTCEERTLNLPRRAATTGAPGQNDPTAAGDVTCTLLAAGASLSLATLPPDVTVVLKAQTSGDAAAPFADESSAPPLPRHAVVFAPLGADLDRRTARRARPVAVLITRSDNRSITRFRVTPPEGPNAPPGLVLYPRRVRDDCVCVDVAWLPPYPAKSAGGSTTAFQVHVDGVTETIPVRLFAKRWAPAVSPAFDAAGGLPSPLSRWTRPALIAGAGTAALGLLLFVLSSGLPAANSLPPQRPASRSGGGAPGLLVSSAAARPGTARPTTPAETTLAPPSLVAAAGTRPNRAIVAAVEGVDRWQNVALWHIAGQNGATFPRVVVDTRNRSPRPGAVLTRLVTRWADLPAALVLTGGLTLSAQDGGPLLLTPGKPARRRPSGALLLVTPAPRRGRGPAFLRPLRPRDAGRFWVFRLSRPVPVGRDRYSLLLSPRPLLVPGAAATRAGNTPRMPGCLLSERGLQAWSPGDSPPAGAGTVLPLPGFTVRVSVIEAAAFASSGDAPRRSSCSTSPRCWVKGERY